MTREFSVFIEKDKDGYFVASVPTLRGCHKKDYRNVPSHMQRHFSESHPVIPA